MERDRAHVVPYKLTAELVRARVGLEANADIVDVDLFLHGGQVHHPQVHQQPVDQLAQLGDGLVEALVVALVDPRHAQGAVEQVGEGFALFAHVVGQLAVLADGGPLERAAELLLGQPEVVHARSPPSGPASARRAA